MFILNIGEMLSNIEGIEISDLNEKIADVITPLVRLATISDEFVEEESRQVVEEMERSIKRTMN